MNSSTLDLRQSAEYDIIINKDRTLKYVMSCYYLTGTTTPVEIEYDFSSYTGATMDIKYQPKSSQTTLSFSTDDGSIVLSTGNTFSLNKTSTEVAGLRAGEYEYDMYISSPTYPKRAFLSGKFIIKDRITS